MSRLDELHGADDVDAVFGPLAHRAVCPFPRAGGIKHSPHIPRVDFLAPAHLALVDPRELWSSQGWVLREHVAYYLTGRWEITGETSADRDRPSNWYPLVVTDHLGRKVIRAGHHRAMAALLRGRPLLARTVPGSTDRAVAVLPHLLLGWTSGLPHIKCRNASEIVETVRGGWTAMGEDPEVVALAARALSPRIDRRRLPTLDHPTTDHPTIMWANQDAPLDVTGRYRLCTTCGGLRADQCPAAHRCNDICSCQPADDGRGDSEARLRCLLCQVCGLEVVKGHSKWRRVVCPTCLPRVRALNATAGATVLAPGVHSFVNGGPWLHGADARDDEALARFATQLNRMGRGVTRFSDLARGQLVDRLRTLGFAPGATVPLEEYLDACRQAGIDTDRGWTDLLDRLTAAN